MFHNQENVLAGQEHDKDVLNHNKVMEKSRENEKESSSKI